MAAGLSHMIHGIAIGPAKWYLDLKENVEADIASLTAERRLGPLNYRRSDALILSGDILASSFVVLAAVMPIVV